MQLLPKESKAQFINNWHLYEHPLKAFTKALTNDLLPLLQTDYSSLFRHKDRSNPLDITHLDFNLIISK